MRLAPSALLLALLSLPRAALADEPPLSRRLRGVYAPFGLVTGAALHGSRSNGFVLGAEASLVYFHGARSPLWVGLYADGSRDLGPRVFRASFGPEIGWGFLGLDGGLALEQGGLRAVVARALFTVGLVSAFVRVGRYVGEAPERGYTELGLLLKWPLPVAR